MKTNMKKGKTMVNDELLVVNDANNLQLTTNNYPKGWEIKKLGECFKLKSGDSLTRKKMNQKGIIPVFGGNGIAGTHDKYNISGNNVIVGRVGALCGNVRNINENIWLTDNAFKIVDYKYDFDEVFLTYLLNYKNLRNYARQSAQPVISNSSLKGVDLEFPKPLKEQKQIVTLLDKAFTAIATAKDNAQQNLLNAKQLFESYLQNVFENKGDDWVEKTLGEVVDFFNGFAFKSKDAIEYSNTQVIRMGNLYKNRLDLDRKSVFTLKNLPKILKNIY